MKDRTHDISLIDYHVKDIETFGKVLNNAAAAAFPRSRFSRYCDVYVLLLSWEDDDLGVEGEIDDLEAAFRDIYRYRVGRWKIPRTRSHNALVHQIIQALGDFESNDKLFITYYGGHGFMNDDRQCVWLSNQQPGAATLQWSSIQTMLEEAECDVLILLDCCAAGSSGGNHGRGVNEVIAACGFEASVPGVGEHSFTRSLIAELTYLNRQYNATSTTLLHNKVLARVKNSWNPRYSTDGSEERRRSPIYIKLSDDTKQRCITLVPLVPSTHRTISSPSLQASSSSLSDPSGSDETKQSSLSEVWPDKQFESPKVLISVALQEDQRLNTEDWLEWVKSIPALADLVEVEGISKSDSTLPDLVEVEGISKSDSTLPDLVEFEGIFKSDSTLLLLTLPVALWDLIPRDPAITFLAFVRSHNLRNHYRSSGAVGIKSNYQLQSPLNTPRWQSKGRFSAADSGYASSLHSYQSSERHDTLLPEISYGPNYYPPPRGSNLYPSSQTSRSVFRCVAPGCGERFTRRDNLEKHMKKTHAIASDVRYKPNDRYYP